MRIVIAGGGQLGAQMAEILTRAHNEVTVAEIARPRVDELRTRLGSPLVLGDACEPGTLEQAGAHNADLLLALTARDEDNLVIGLLAKTQFAVPRVIARVNDPDNAWLFDARWGIDVAVAAEESLIALLEEATASADTVALLRLSRAGVDVFSTAIGPDSAAAGQLLGDLSLPPATIVAAVIRTGQPITPTAAVRLECGDELLVVTHSHGASEQDVHAVFH